MDRSVTVGRLSAAAMPIGLLCCAWALTRWPQTAADAMAEGLSVCTSAVIPTLFPFLVLSSCVVELGLAQQAGRLLSPVTARLFHITAAGSGALILGFLGGYPVGARTVISLYQTGQCSRREAQSLLTFCNNCGPAFLLGMVGYGIFGSRRLGGILYACHVLSALLIGFLFRPPSGSTSKSRSVISASPSFSAAFTHSVGQALSSILNICSFVLTFTVLIRLLEHSGILSRIGHGLALIFPLDPIWIQRLLRGMLEMTSGLRELSPESLFYSLPMAAFFLGWGGLSVHFQVLSLLDLSDLPCRGYFLGKLLHGLLSAGLISLWMWCFPNSCAVFSAHAGQSAVSYPVIPPVVSLSVFTAWLMWLLFFLFFALLWKKRSDKLREGIL